MSWNYRVMRHTYNDVLSGGSETYLAIHEVYYKNSDVDELLVSASDVAFTKNPVFVGGETVTELSAVLIRMLQSLDKPIIEYAE